MNTLKKQQLLVRIAKLYYEEELSQEKIAQILELSRPYVSKLLNEAKEEGIVRIQVIDPLNIETSMEAEFRRRFRLEKAIILPRQNGGEPLRHLGEAAARYLNDILDDHSVIGTSWGETIYECTKALIPRRDLHDIICVQMCGGASSLSQAVYTSNIADNFSANLGAVSYLLPVPAVVESGTVSDMLLKDGNIAHVVQLALEADIALFTAGAFGQRNALYRAGYLKDADIEKLTKKGAVGDVCSHVIDVHGKICDKKLDGRTMAIPLDKIKQKKYRICIAHGFSKIDCLCGILNGGIANVLIIDEETAEYILRRLEEL